LFSFGKPTTSIVELPSKEGKGSGYTINVFTNPDQHTKTYEIKHGEKFYRVVEKSRDGRDKDKSTALARENLPTPASQDEVSPPQPTVTVYEKTASDLTNTPMQASFKIAEAPSLNEGPSSMMQPAFSQMLPLQAAANVLPAAQSNNQPSVTKQQAISSGSIRSPVLPPQSILSIPKSVVTPTKQPSLEQLYQRVTVNSAGDNDHDLTVTLDTNTVSSSPLKNSGRAIQQFQKTSKPAIVGTRKTSLPPLPAKRSSRHNGGISPSIGNTLLKDRNVSVATATNSQHHSNQDDFDKTLNAAIVLK